MNPAAVLLPPMEVLTTLYSAYRLQYHVVWMCKYRYRIRNPGIRAYLHKILLKLCGSMPDVTIETIGFDNDHVHGVIVIAPK